MPPADCLGVCIGCTCYPVVTTTFGSFVGYAHYLESLLFLDPPLVVVGHVSVPCQEHSVSFCYRDNYVEYLSLPQIGLLSGGPGKPYSLGFAPKACVFVGIGRGCSPNR